MTERQEQILKLIGERNYVTVNDLAKILFTSPSSIRRDLTYMQNNGLVKRSHGGVTLPEPISGVASFHDRMQKNRNEKRLIAKKAASLLKNGQNILLDSSSTSSFMLPHIAKLTSPTVFTNNLSTALSAIELGIDTHCIGGHSINGSAALSGIEAYKTLAEIQVDILFFSSQCLDKNGIISDSTQEENYIRQLMMKSAKQTVFLCDSKKFNQSALYKLASLEEIDYAIFDEIFEELNTSITII